MNRAKLINLFFVGLIVVLSACTMNGELPEYEKNKLKKCVDMRDGETFYFNTNSIHDIRVGIGCPTSFKIVTTNGDTVLLNDNMEAWLKVRTIAQTK